MHLLGVVLKVPRQRTAHDGGAPVAELRPEAPSLAGTRPGEGPGAQSGSTPRRRLLASWLIVVASLWSIHVASNDFEDLRAWDAASTCAATDAACLARHDVTTQPVTGRVEVTDHVARVMLMPAAGADREVRTVFLRGTSDLGGIDLRNELRVLRHGDTALGLVDADGTRWTGLTATPSTVTLQTQWGMLGLVVGWFLVVRRDLRPFHVAAVGAVVVGIAALVGASIGTMWSVLTVLLLAGIVLSRRPDHPSGRSASRTSVPTART